MRLRPLVFLSILVFGIALARAQEPDSTETGSDPATTAEPAKDTPAPAAEPETAAEPEAAADAGAAAEPGAAADAGAAAEPEAAATATDATEAEASPPEPDVEPNPKLAGYDEDGGAGKRIFVVPIEGTIELGLASFVERVINQAEPEDIIILKVRTFGGRVDAAVRIRDALLETDSTTVAFVRRAISAGALISLACDTIIMSREASIGAVTPVTQSEGEMKAASEKVVSYMRAEMGATAEANGRRRDVAEAMVDADIEIEGVTIKGKLVTLTTKQALELEMAEDQAKSLPAAIALLNLNHASRVEAEEDWGEMLARFLTDPVVSSLLMSLGFLGLMMELFTPGFGVPGSIGVACLSLFFLGQYAANLAGAEEAILFTIGFALLALEVFVIPGFGAAGIAGIGCVAVALGMSMVELELPWDVSFELGYMQDALATAVIRLTIVLAILVVATMAMFKWAPRSRAGGWLIFRARTVEGIDPAAGLGAEAPGGSLTKKYDHLLGKQGEAKTVLRPSGVAVIDGQRVHVLTDGTFLDPGQKIEVIEVDGHRVIVRRLETDAPDEDEA